MCTDSPSASLIPPTLDVDELLAFHRATFGSARMEDGGGAGGETEGGAGGESSGEGQSGGSASSGGEAGGAGGEQNAGSTPKTFDETYVRGLREEAAGYRRQLRESQDKQQAQLDGIAKALGLKSDEVDPAELTKQLGEAQSSARTAATNLAVFQAAGKHQADPAALIDSSAFQAKVATLDTADEKFATTVDDLIAEAVKTNPRLKAAPVAGSSSADHAGGSGEGAGKPKTLSDAISSHYGS